MKRLLTQSRVALAMFVLAMLTMAPTAFAAPSNDDFGDAAVVSSTPYSDSQDYSDATVQGGEPVPSCGSGTQTLWYSYTPTANGLISASLEGSSANVLAVYTGLSITTLTQINCAGGSSYSKLALQVNAGTTYYFQTVGGTEELTFKLRDAVVVDFSYDPSDPSIFDDIAFDGVSDLDIQSWEWDFGDGATGDSQNENHQYSQDGDYTVTLDVTSVAGDTASATKVVQVKTHDVAISKFTAPSTGQVGQTRSLAVCVKNKRYTETVTVKLWKNYTLFGMLTQEVSVQPTSTCFKFSYTFTKNDAQVGTVVFSAEAALQGARDAFPPDNMAIANPTKVK